MGLSGDELVAVPCCGTANSDASAVELLRDGPLSAKGMRSLFAVCSPLSVLVCQRILTSFTFCSPNASSADDLEALLHVPAIEILDIFREESRSKTQPQSAYCS